MSVQHDIHTETESEDGGVSLSVFAFSDEMESDHDSAPTSASQSPSPSSLSLANALQSTSYSTSEDPTPSGHTVASAMDPNLSVEPLILDAPTTNLHESSAHQYLPNLLSLVDDSFAQALSGELMNLPDSEGLSGFSGAEDGMDSLSEPVGTLEEFTMEGFPTSEGAIEDDPHGPLMHTSGSHAISQTDVHELEPVSIPSFDALLAQAGGPYHSQIIDTDAMFDMEEDFADFWDDADDNMKNFNCDIFFNYWKRMFAHKMPSYSRISDLANNLQKVQRPDRITAYDLRHPNPKQEDIQGIHWSRFQTTKEEARKVRRMTYTNWVNVCHGYPRQIGNNGALGSEDYKIRFSEDSIPSSDLYYSFEEMNTKFKAYISHFQLRHNLFASSKNALFYNAKPSKGYGAFNSLNGFRSQAKIMCFNPGTDTDECAMDLGKVVDRDAPKISRPTTLTASDGVLVIGSYEGNYAMKSLSANFESKPTTGVITNVGINGSTNHIHNFLHRRSGLPQAVFSSNDLTIRVLDCTTDKFVRHHLFPYPVNCSATSPDGRLRLLVGDGCYPILADAETGENLANLPGHTNYGFACAWAPDGVTMATGHQDGFVQVWDARKLTESLRSIPMEMAGCRTLQFSPLGGGKRVLVLAEPADFVHIVDAQTFDSKQVIEFFGEIAGISMPPDGSSLYISNQDHRYGGLMEYERSWNARGFGYQRRRRRRPLVPPEGEEWDAERLADSLSAIDKDLSDEKLGFRRRTHFDWRPEEDLEDDERVVLSKAQRDQFGWM